MTYRIDDAVWRIMAVYDSAKIKLPKPRAFALRLLEEAVELALACGASHKDMYVSFMTALGNEQAKDLERQYDAERVEAPEAIADEIADVCLLAAATAVTADVSDERVQASAVAKVARLEQAAANGTLHFTLDGRFYQKVK